SRSRGRESTARSYVRSASGVKGAGERALRFLLWVALLAPGCRAQPRGPCNPEPSPGELGTICGFENPEDVEAVPAARVVLVSEIRVVQGTGGGALSAVPLDGPPVPRRRFPPPRPAARGAASLIGGPRGPPAPPAA